MSSFIKDEKGESWMINENGNKVKLGTTLSSTISNVVNIPKNEFEKVSWDQFKKDSEKILLPYLKKWKVPLFRDFDDNEKLFKETYDAITLPRRSTKGSAGYDFYIPFDGIPLYPGESVIIPTGIKMQLISGYFLGIYPRSSYGFKYKMRLDNTVGIIDSDYYNNSDNEGHIMIKVTCETLPPFDLGVGYPLLYMDRKSKFAQGIIMPYGTTYNDNPCDNERTGGIGSTGK